MSKVVQRLRRNETGAALVEYALIVAGVALIGPRPCRSSATRSPTCWARRPP